MTEISKKSESGQWAVFFKGRSIVRFQTRKDAEEYRAKQQPELALTIGRVKAGR